MDKSGHHHHLEGVFAVFVAVGAPSHVSEFNSRVGERQFRCRLLLADNCLPTEELANRDQKGINLVWSICWHVVWNLLHGSEVIIGASVTIDEALDHVRAQRPMHLKEDAQNCGRNVSGIMKLNRIKHAQEPLAKKCSELNAYYRPHARMISKPVGSHKKGDEGRKHDNEHKLNCKIAEIVGCKSILADIDQRVNYSRCLDPKYIKNDIPNNSSILVCLWFGIAHYFCKNHECVDKWSIIKVKHLLGHNISSADYEEGIGCKKMTVLMVNDTV